MAEMTKVFGMKESSIKNYYNIYKLSKEINLKGHRDVLKKIDTNTLAGIETSKQ